MVLRIGFTDHDEAEAIAREITTKTSRICSRHGLETIRVGMDHSMIPVMAESLSICRLADEIERGAGLNAAIWAALAEMGAVPDGIVAAPIRWQAVFFIGVAGSGKTFIRDVKYTRHLDFKVVDPDLIKQAHPEYDPSHPFKLHQWSKDISNAEFRKIVENGNGDPVIVDGTGRNVEGVLSKIKMAKANGYRTYIVYVWVPFEISIFRNRNRSRFVPESIVQEQAEKIGKSFGILKSIADKSKVIPNYNRSELGDAEADIRIYPVPQGKRPPRPGDSDYGIALAASEGLGLRLRDGHFRARM